MDIFLFKIFLFNMTPVSPSLAAYFLLQLLSITAALSPSAKKVTDTDLWFIWLRFYIT